MEIDLLNDSSSQLHRLVGAGRKVSRGTFRARLHAKGLEALDQKENGLTLERKISSGFHVEQILVVNKAA